MILEITVSLLKASVESGSTFCKKRDRSRDQNLAVRLADKRAH